MRSFRSAFGTVHYWSFYALLVAIMIHIVGVFVPERFTPNSWTLLLGEVGPTRGVAAVSARTRHSSQLIEIKSPVRSKV
jgi:hypothetical protein